MARSSHFELMPAVGGPRTRPHDRRLQVQRQSGDPRFRAAPRHPAAGRPGIPRGRHRPPPPARLNRDTSVSRESRDPCNHPSQAAARWIPAFAGIHDGMAVWLSAASMISAGVIPASRIARIVGAPSRLARRRPACVGQQRVMPVARRRQAEQRLQQPVDVGRRRTDPRRGSPGSRPASRRRP